MSRHTRSPTIVQRFWDRVNKDCWGWNGSVDDNGYATLPVGPHGAGMVRAHIISFEIHHGPVPEGMCVLHTCDNKPCTNPDHLYPGTRADNNRDKLVRGRQGRSITISEDQIGLILRHPEMTTKALAGLVGVGSSSVHRIRHGRQRRALAVPGIQS